MKNNTVEENSVNHCFCYPVASLVHELLEENHRNFGWGRKLLGKRIETLAADASCSTQIVDTLAADANYLTKIIVSMASAANGSAKIVVCMASAANGSTKIMVCLASAATGSTSGLHGFPVGFWGPGARNCSQGIALTVEFDGLGALVRLFAPWDQKVVPGHRFDSET